MSQNNSASATSTSNESSRKVYKLLGSSGLRVFPLALGTGHFGYDSIYANSFGVGSSDEENEKVFLRYIEAGGNFIDTANFYQDGNSEKLIGDLIKKHNISREELVIATKYSLATKPQPNSYGNHKKNLVQSINASLKRLQTDYVDILYIHFWDYTADTYQLVRALDVRSGKVLHVAISNTPAWEVARANSYAEFHALSPFISYTGNYSLSDRSMENDIIPMAKKLNIGIVPWSVLGGGKLSGKSKRGDSNSEASRRPYVQMTEKDYDIQDVLLEIAEESGRTPSQVAINWILSKSFVSSALIGPSSLQQLEDNLKALEFELTSQQLERLDKVSEQQQKSFPYSLIGQSLESGAFSPKTFKILQ